MHPLILVKKPTIKLPVSATAKLKGRFVVELIHARTGIVKRKLEFDNLITDAGLNAIHSGTQLHQLFLNTSAASYVEVGTGSTPPAVSDTSLESSLGGTNSNGGFSSHQVEGPGSSNGWFESWRFYRVFTEAQVNGNLTEIGIRLTDNPSSALWSRTLFVDEVGDPVTIVKTNEDQLKISYTLGYQRMVTPLEQIDFPIVTPRAPGGTPTLVTVRGHGNNGQLNGSNSNPGYIIGTNWNTIESNAMPGTASNPVGTASPSANATIAAYVAGTFYREGEARWGAAAGNFVTGIGLIGVRGIGVAAAQYSHYITFSPKIDKLNTERLVFQMRFSYGRM